MNTHPATQPDPATPPPAAATSPAAPTAEAAPRRRYKNPHRSERLKVRAALRGVDANFDAAAPEELATLAEFVGECRRSEGRAREWERRAASGGFVTPTGARLSPDECRARADADRKRAEDARRNGHELLAAINTRVPFRPSYRTKRGRVAVRPIIKPRP